MGVQGLWKLVHERGKHEPLPRLGGNGSKTLLIDASPLEWAARAACTEKYASEDLGALLVRHWRRGHYPEVESCIIYIVSLTSSFCAVHPRTR